MSDNIPMKTDPNGVATLAGHVKEIISSAKAANKERKKAQLKRQDHFAAQAASHGGTGGMAPEHVLKALRMTMTHERKMTELTHGHAKDLTTHVADTVGKLGGANTQLEVNGLKINHTPTPATPAKPAAKPRTRTTTKPKPPRTPKA